MNYMLSLKELIVFNKYKDKVFRNSSTLKGEITKKYKNIDVTKVYTKIVNYQINKYGGALSVRTMPKRKEV